MNTVWVNGQLASDLPVTDRGLTYGDGVFETIRVSSKELTLSDLHWQRLSASVDRLLIPLDIDQLKEECHQFLQESDHVEGVLKIIVTRGSGGRGYNPAGCDHSRRILSFHALPRYPASLSSEGAKVLLCHHRISHSVLAGIKHLNRLDQVLSRAEWHTTEYDEGLVMDFDNHLIEGTMSNLFLVDDDGLLMTPLLDRSGVAGVARAYILKEADSWGLSVIEQRVSQERLAQAREVFLVNSVNGVWPVVACGALRWPVGNITQTIRDRILGVLNA